MLNSAGHDPSQRPAAADIRKDSNEPDGSRSEEVSDDARMNGVLAQILSVAESGGSAGIDSTCRAELLAVARKFASHDFCLEPVLLELVQVLTGRIRGISEVRRTAMERSVTATLYEDQTSMSRLQRLWTHLTELVTHAE